MTNSAYQNYAQMMNALSFIGVTQIRDTYDNPYTTAEFALMGRQLNLKFDFFIALGSASPEWQLSQIRSNPSIVSYVEGYNESDSWWQDFHGATGAQATAAVQQYIYGAVKTDPALAGIGVIQATFASPGGFAAYGAHADTTDYASTHTYFGTGNNPSGSEGIMIAEAQSASPGRPTITTEAGYSTNAGDPHGVSDLVQAKYDLDLLFEQAKLGVKLTYLWELADNYADSLNTNREDHYGLFNNDWSPKIAALALHDTMQIMADPGTGGVTPGTLDVAFDGLPGSVQSSLYQKSDGTFVLVVWNDVRLSGPTVQGDIVVAPIATTLHLGQRFAQIAIFDPLTGTSSIQRASNTDTVSLQVVDHPLIIELSQDPNFQSVGNAIAGPSLVTTNPLATVQVDGVSVASQSAGPITVHLHAGGLMSVLDPNGHLLAGDTYDITLTGSVATVNAELATLDYQGGNGLGSDTIAISSVDASGTAATRAIAVTIEAGTTATNSGGPAISVPEDFIGIAGAYVRIPRATVSDTYAATHDGTLALLITSHAGLLLLPDGIGAVTGNGTGTVGLSGSFAQIRAALASLSYQAPTDGGGDYINYTVIDQTGFSFRQTTFVTVQDITTVNAAEIPLTTVAPIATATLAQDSAPDPVNSTGTGTGTAVYRFFDRQNGTQFLTASLAERDTIVATRPDLVPEGVGIGALAAATNDPNAEAVYRFFDTQGGTHFYTSSSSERDTIEATRSDLKFEGVSFYEHTSQAAGDAAVYRFFDSTNGTHFFTASQSERGSILATRPDLIQEGVAFYAPTT